MSSTKKLRLTKFRMTDIVFDKRENKGPVIAMIGKRDTGKSFLIRDLLFHFQDLTAGLVISGSEAVNHFYEAMIPKCFIEHEYSTSLISRMLERQKLANNSYSDEVDRMGSSKKDPRVFICLDDALFDDKWTRDKVMRFLFMNGRHWKVMLIIAMQYPLGIPPVLRTNIDYVFILREPTASNRERIYRNYASMFPTQELFNEILDQTTENFGCLVLNNNSKSNQLQDMIYWYKAEAHDNVKLCDKAYWDKSEKLKGKDTQDNYQIQKRRNYENVVVERVGNNNERRRF